MNRVILATALAALGCDGQRTVTGTAPANGLTVRVHVAADLASAAQALGWPGSIVPGATVVAVWVSDGAGDASADSARTDASGVSHFGGLRAGRYSVSVSRAFASDELARAGKALGNVDALAGFGTITIGSSGADTVEVELRGVGGSALVFSEVYETEPLLGDGGVYYYGGYFKVYNNADTTVQLAGKIFFDAWPGYIQGPLYGCNTFSAVQNDPAGLWASYVFRFPITAQPLKPGEAAVIATDAIDHRQIKNAAGFFDLSRAGFEFKGGKDAHNPAAQGMLDIGPRSFAADGHGWRTGGGRQVIGLASALDISALPAHFDPILGGGQTLLRIPKAALLDVVQYKPKDSGYTSPYPDCVSSVVPDIDAAEARDVIRFTDTLSMHRRGSRTLPSGRIILQRSRNSAADWVAAPATPYQAP